MRYWVLDTSPLIFLSKLGRLELLPKEGFELVVPPAVVAEIRHRQDPVTHQVNQALRSWLTILPAPSSVSEVLAVELGLGEAEALALAREIHAEKIVLDDQDARRWAQKLGLSIVGTLGILLAARLRGDLPSLRSEIERLQASDFRISSTLIHKLLETAGEEPSIETGRD